MALTKAYFAEQLFDELGLKKREGKDIVELFFEEIKRTLEQGEPGVMKILNLRNYKSSLFLFPFSRQNRLLFSCSARFHPIHLCTISGLFLQA
jgi:hypothetical protein